MAGPGDQTSAAEGRNHGDLRASHADRERVIGTLKAAYVEGRLTEDELDARVGQVYASRTYAELAKVTAEVTADIPADPARTRSTRDPWRATKIDLGWLTHGDAKSRFDAYQIGRNMGVYSANEIREKEGENTIGPEGDVDIAAEPSGKQVAEHITGA